MKNITFSDIQGYKGEHTDYKAEVIAYAIWKKHSELDGVFLKRLGSNNRSFHKDLKQIKVEFLDVKENRISVESYREGLYDYLPEGLFHPPSFKNSRQTIGEVVEQIRQEKKVEQKLRAFFQPFELEVYFSYLNALALRASFDGLEQQDQLVSLFEELWPVLRLLDDKKTRILASLFPHLHAYRGKKDWVEKCLKTLLGVPVEIHITPSKLTGFDELAQDVTLGNAQVGLTMVLAAAYFEGTANWTIEFGPIAYEELHLYVEGSPLRVLLQTFYDYCVPVTVAVLERFTTQKKEQAFCLDNNNCCLGYSTYL
ncbi:hypothetical protein [Myroides sp. DW712]|uniref:hypothetical protein n=1 Tax=Myroides sp. DW712 TaxID=3389800 RepID=UPI00397C0A79